MIELYAFDNANTNGDKEAVIVPNVPTPVNKLSANETNNLKDKLNEVVAVVNLAAPSSNVVDFLELRLKLKGSQGGVANVADTLEVGDVVHGFSEAGVIWTDAMYNGGDPSVRANYTSNIYVKRSELANPDRILALGTESVSGNVFTYQDYLWVLDGQEYSNTTPDVLTIAPATAGFKRKDISVFTNNGTIQIIQGAETDGPTVTTPEVPEGTLYFKFYDIDGATVTDDPTTPILGDILVRKSDFQTVENTQSGADVIVSLPLNGASYINLTNPLLESISGVSFLAPIDEENEPPYPGKPFIFRNLTGNPITIKNNQSVLFFERSFETKDALDIIIPNNEMVRFDYATEGMKDVFRSWSGASTTGTEIIIHATYFVPNSLQNNHGFSLTTSASASDAGTGPTMSSNAFTSWARRQYISASTAGSSILFTNGSFRMIRYISDVAFKVTLGFANSDDSLVSTGRNFFGFLNSQVVGNVDPSTLTNCFGLANDSADGNLKIIHNGGAGVSTKIDLGSSFPANTVSLDYYVFEYWKEKGSMEIFYKVTNRHTGVVASGSVTSNLPNSGVYFVNLQRNNGSTASAVKLSLSHHIVKEII